MKFRPCLDLHEGKVKQIVGSTLAGADEATPVTNFISDKSAGYYAGLFKADNLTGGHVIMLGPGNEDALRESLHTYPGAFHAGGGMKPENAGYWLAEGAAKIIVSSYIFSEGKFSADRLAAVSAVTGKDRLVIDLSSMKSDGVCRVMTDKWRRMTDLILSPAVLSKLSAYASEFLIHAVDVEGTGAGIDTALIEAIAGFDECPITYAGGISSVQDIEKLNTIGHGKIDFTVGSALDIYGEPKRSFADMAVLYVTALPIGNPRDITLRALDVLKECDAVICEELRPAETFLKKYDIVKDLYPLNEHNAAQNSAEYIRLIKKSRSRNPAFADPGNELIAQARQQGITVSVLPGASSVAAALSLSGFDISRFFFAGFPPRERAERMQFLRQLSGRPYPIVLMDTSYRLHALLEQITEIFPADALMTLCLDLTKSGERVLSGTAADIISSVDRTAKNKAEFVLIVASYIGAK
ncbi:hypothetical protein CHS0354_018467 [Potamilus streckersoni]|uniref:1-(5-phosphoribosyl)-5-[(5-phosphoribosylamino)methylideneamino]imidazole-4-carboxamideisomerase n=1 Tax=Potamilus streckersoni TaxID=2493646 RepID=A0AAE0TBB3_9BIVA|nr:hypothetical protein CHS0354_018467 [Potamilus streckersoni]